MVGVRGKLFSVMGLIWEQAAQLQGHARRTRQLPAPLLPLAVSSSTRPGASVAPSGRHEAAAARERPGLTPTHPGVQVPTQQQEQAPCSDALPPSHLPHERINNFVGGRHSTVYLRPAVAGGRERVSYIRKMGQ